jgi:hypothetical protein
MEIAKRLDRTLQRNILLALEAAYPNRVSMFALTQLGMADDVLIANVRYLFEHRLVDATWLPTSSGLMLANAVLSANGVDFLADDGGLTAVLGVITVKLHEDTIKALLIDSVNASPAEATIKSKLVEQIKGLPAEAIKYVTMEGLKMGIAHIPDVAAFIQTALSSQ